MTFPNVYDDGEGYQLILLMLMDGKTKTIQQALETLMASINARLNKKTLANSNITITLYLENKLTLTDDVPTIRRRKVHLSR